MKQIFLISGSAQSGKDSTANFLKNKLNGKSLIIHNADFLKFMAKQYLEWNGLKDDAGRTLLQKLGTEKIRLGLHKPLYWVERSCDVIEFFENDFDYFMIPDCRFRNELFFPQAKFPGKIITMRIKRLNFDNGLTEEQKNHISEKELADFPHDYYIESESGLDKLEVEVDKFLEIFIN